MTFGENLKALRKERGLTQEEFAKQSGVSRSAIGMYESGKREPSFETLELFSDFFNVDMNKLLEQEPPAAPPSAQEAEEAPYKAPDRRDIGKRLEAIVNDFDDDNGLAMLEGEEIDEHDKELLLASIKSSLEQAKLLAKKYTPRKYRKIKTQEEGDHK